MSNVKCVLSEDARESTARQHRALPAGRNPVHQACQDAGIALDRLSHVLFEAAPGADSRIESAVRRLARTLFVFQQASCTGLADMREKCRTFRRLADLLSIADPQLQLIACGLAQEMGDLLESCDLD